MLKIAIDLLTPSAFKPTHIISSIPQLLALASVNKPQQIVFDKDDTLTTLHEFQVRDPKIKETLLALKEMGVKMHILSNSIKQGDPKYV